METSIPHLREILVFLTAAGVLVPLMQKFKISPVLGFLLAGLLLGPHGAGLLAHVWPPIGTIVITESEGVHALAEMGIVFLLFMIGLELSFERLSTMRKKVFGFGGLQVGITAMVIGSIAWAFGNKPETSMLLGLGFALSSTAIVMQILAENKRMGSLVGRASFAILLFQDLSVILLLFFLGFTNLGVQGGLSSPSALAYLGKALWSAATATIGIVIIGRLVLRPVFKMVGKGKNTELFIAATLLTVISIAAGAEAVGLSMGLGAFLAGLLVAETEYRHDVESAIEPFKGLLMGLFFMSVGMSVDLRMVLGDPFWILASVIGLFAVKAGIIFTIARTLKVTTGRALELGLLLGQAGEFAFVLLAMASDMKLISENDAQFMLIVTSLSMMITPLVARMAYRVRLVLDGPDVSIYGPDAFAVDAIDNHVILAGYGRMGHVISDILNQQNIPCVAIDHAPEAVAPNDVPLLKGDATDYETLNKAGIRRAVAVAVLIDKTEEARKVVEMVKSIDPKMLIVARARDGQHAAELFRLGATATIPDMVEGSLHVAHELLTHIGVPMAAATKAVERQRTIEAAEIQQAIKSNA
ncbi:MAG: cation:proton antiporter [Alphaproteobacteria bacterium]|nr:cation:proton antiporter [Alphaproteobacteria bacterium]